MRIQKRGPAPSHRGPRSLKGRHWIWLVNKINIPSCESGCVFNAVQRVKSSCLLVPEGWFISCKCNLHVTSFVNKCERCTPVPSRQQHGGPSRCHIRPEESKLAGVFLAALLFSRVIAVCFMSPVRDCCCNHGVFSSLPQISRYTELGVVRMWWEILWVIFFFLQGTEWSFGRAHQNRRREWFIGYKGWQTSIGWRGLNTVVLWFLHKTWNKYGDFPAFHSVLKEKKISKTLLNLYKRWLLDILVAFGSQDF